MWPLALTIYDRSCIAWLLLSPKIYLRSSFLCDVHFSFLEWCKYLTELSIIFLQPVNDWKDCCICIETSFSIWWRRRKCNFWKMAPTLTKSVSFLPLCNSLIDGSFKLGRRSSKKMDPFFGGGVARGEKLFLHLAGSYHSFLRRFRSPVATFHLQDNKYPKSNFSTTFSFTALPFSLLVPSNYQWHFATTRN